MFKTAKSPNPMLPQRFPADMVRPIVAEPSSLPVPNPQEVAIRRNREDSTWRICDDDRVNFRGLIQCGLMSDVRFVHRASAMECELGYASTGEVIGTILEDTLSLEDVEMPSDVRRKAQVWYDRESRCFHVKDKPEERIDKADYLLLAPDGRAFAGWVQ